MTRLIGSRWKHCKVLSRGVLICPVSCAELWITQSERLRFCYLSICMYLQAKRACSAGDSSEGSYPISFRTRQSSPLEPMVLALTGRESRLSPALWARLRLYIDSAVAGRVRKFSVFRLREDFSLALASSECSSAWLEHRV